MPEIVQIAIPEVGIIFLEGENIEEFELTSSKDLRKRVTNVYQDALATIDAVAVSVSNQMKELNSRIDADEYQVEFGVKLSTEVGAILASAATEATIKVSIKWSKPDSSK